MIYADNAATTQLDMEAYQAMDLFFKHEYGNPSSAYSFSRLPRQAIREARATIASCIGAEYEEIFFTSGGTESNNWALKGVALKNKGQKEQIITSEVEHHATVNSCSFLKSIGFEIISLPVNSYGEVEIEKFTESISKKTSLVSLILVNNEIGTIQEISSLVSATHNSGALFHTDAVQAVGHIPIDVKRLGIDLLSASAHKFNGPKGIGFLYIKSGLEILPFISGGSQEMGFRAGTENVPSIVGMAVALKNNISSMQSNREHLEKLSSIFINRLRLSGLDFLLNGSKQRLPGHISISIKNESGERLLHRLDLDGICVSTGSACNASKTEVSHVIKALNIPSSYAQGTVRVSFGKKNTEEDAVKIAESICRICQRHKKLSPS